MKVRIALLIENIKVHFWVIPSLIILIIIAMLFTLKQVNIFSNITYLEELLFLKATPEGARQLLSSIATSIMTVVGVMFSIIVVVIQQMSNQFTPRIVSNFTRSSMGQIVLGFYVGTYIYCLILLMNIPRRENYLVPKAALLFAAVLAIFCLILLILYIHHVTRSIQSTEIISNIAKESVASYKNIMNDRKAADTGHRPDHVDLRAEKIIYSEESGFVESIDWAKLPTLINEDAWRIVLHITPGDYVQKKMKLFTISTRSEFLKTEKLDDFIQINSARTDSQDPGYGLQKLTDISLKALSPGINDPSTAIEAVHSITGILSEFIRSGPIKNEISLSEMTSIKFRPQSLDELIEEYILPIKQFGKEHKKVIKVIESELRYLSAISSRELS